MSSDTLASLGITTLRQRIDELRGEHSYRWLGEALGIDHDYLERLRNGQNKEPSDGVLAKLGLRRNVMLYVYYTDVTQK